MNCPRKTLGFTLVELMVALVVVGLLATVALPSYRHLMLRVQRNEAKSELLQTAAALERCYAHFNTYDSADCATRAALPRPTESGHYLIGAAVLTAGNYRLSAVPQGGQAQDLECKTLTVDSASVKGISDGATETAGYCWSH
jgi:type IV pilus assembly protein PilE